MYITTLPDHTQADFDDALYFSKFKKHNIIFNTVSSSSSCDDHVGCLSFKTVLSGEEWYTVNKRKIAVRPGKFLILNDDQNYACRIDQDKVKGFSVFFKKEFAAEVFRNELNNEEILLDHPFDLGHPLPEFYQALNSIPSALQLQLEKLIVELENDGYHALTDEKLIFLLQHLLQTHRSDVKLIDRVAAIKPSSKKEIYKRLCIAKDFLHSTFMDKVDLNTMSNIACLSVPQLVRQFKSTFKVTPYQYLVQLRLQYAVELLRYSDKSIHEITWLCGFENVSAFCRAFKSAYGIPPLNYRKATA